jgi:hypothetical protein
MLVLVLMLLLVLVLTPVFIRDEVCRCGTAAMSGMR